MYTRLCDRLLDPIRSRWSILLCLTAGAAFAAGGCGGDGGVEPGPDRTVTLTLAGTGRGTVIGSAGGLNCTNANDTGTPTGTCQADIASGTEVTLAASPAAGSSFAGWSGNGITCPASAPCTFTVSQAQTITATFNGAPTAQLLTVVGGGAGTGSGTIVSEPAGIDCAIAGGVAAATGCTAQFPASTAVQLAVEAGTLVGYGGACSGATCSVVMSDARTVIATFAADAQATQLTFVVQPSAVQVGQPITPPVQVAIQDAAGQTVAGRTDAITLRIATNPGGATLGGQVTRNAVSGVATFTDLALSLVGDGYTLAAAATGLPEETSSGFNVTTEPAARLAFATQPTTTAAGTAIAAITVEVRDQLGAVLTTRTDQITVSLQNNPGGSTLGGSTTATAVAGVATFSNLTLDKAATGYVLAAAATAAGGATSSAFDIVAGTPILATRNSSPGPQSAPVNTAVGERPSVKVVDAFNNPVPGVPVIWEVTAGGGHVVASTTDDVVRPTGPLGLSTAVSWTLGPDVGNENNELRATVDAPGITGSPITFKASGTIPPGQGIFSGVLKQIGNTGFLQPPVLIPNASLQFVNLNTDQPVGTTTSRSDGTFTSPPLPGGNPYQIKVTATNFKAISFAKPVLNAGGAFSLGDLGMVPFDDAQGTAAIGFAVKLSDVPDNSVTVHVDVLRGYFVGETDEDFIENSDDQDTDEAGIANFGIDPLGDWGLLTVRVSAPGYVTQDRLIVVDDPLGQRGPCDEGEDPEDNGCVETFELAPIP